MGLKWWRPIFSPREVIYKKKQDKLEKERENNERHTLSESVWKKVPSELLAKKNCFFCEAVGRQAENGVPTNLLVSESFGNIKITSAKIKWLLEIGNYDALVKHRKWKVGNQSQILDNPYHYNVSYLFSNQIISCTFKWNSKIVKMVICKCWT